MEAFGGVGVLASPTPAELLAVQWKKRSARAKPTLIQCDSSTKKAGNRKRPHSPSRSLNPTAEEKKNIATAIRAEVAAFEIRYA